MGNNVTVTRGEEKFEFENIVMHQIGNGAVQIVQRDGNQTVINRFDEVYITLDAESRAQFEMDLATMEAQSQGQLPVEDEEFDEPQEAVEEEELEEEASEDDAPTIQ